MLNLQSLHLLLEYHQHDFASYEINYLIRHILKLSIFDFYLQDLCKVSLYLDGVTDVKFIFLALEFLLFWQTQLDFC